MARFDIGYRSPIMERTVQVTVLIPDECGESDVPLVYLLHGMHGDHTNWTRNAQAEYYARKYKTALVLADAENSYYATQKYGYDYFSFFSEELPQMVHRWFRQLTTDPAKTFVAGLSMGGYGALLLGLSHPERYGGIASFSGVNDLAGRMDRECDWENIAIANWGENYREVLPGSRYDLMALVNELEKAGKPLPKIYLSCGTEDELIEDYRVFYDRIAAYPDARLLGETAPGGHTWAFWNASLPRALDFFTELS